MTADSERSLAEHLIAHDPVMLIVNADPCDQATIERVVATIRTGLQTRHLPVLVLVSPANLLTVQECLHLAPIDFILKPFNRDELWARLRVGFHQASALGELQKQNDELARQSVTDSLTGLFNTRYIVERCDEEISRARRYGYTVSCLLVDIDRFKLVNDNYGHPVGNETLRRLADLLRGIVRRSDYIGRYGGEEFLLVLPQTDRRGALILAERLRRAVEDCTLVIGPHEVRVTASLGVATFPDKDIVGRETLFVAVDRAAYRAKAMGRNRVAWHQSEDETQECEEGPTLD